MEERKAPPPRPCPPWCTRRHTGDPTVRKHHAVVADLQLGDVTALVELVSPERLDGRPTVGPGIRLALSGKGGRTDLDLTGGEAHMVGQVLAEALDGDGVELLFRALLEAAAALAAAEDAGRDGDAR